MPCWPAASEPMPLPCHTAWSVFHCVCLRDSLGVCWLQDNNEEVRANAGAQGGGGVSVAKI
jgi:hypothetical protein